MHAAAITKRHGGLAARILVPVMIGQTGSAAALTQYDALWDTGASHCCVTQKVVDECGLIQTGIVTVATAGGAMKRPQFVTDIILRTNHVIPGVPVTLCDLDGPGCAQVIIGMQLITLGDMALTNVGNKTTFTFRLPPHEELDFAKHMKAPGSDLGVPRVGRNSPCPCGSGRKYKQCCLGRPAESK